MRGLRAAWLAAPVLLAACASLGEGGGRAAPPGTTLAGDILVAQQAASRRDNATAAQRFRAALAADPSSPDLLERAFVFSLAAGDVDAAAALAPALLQANPSSQLAHLVLGIDALKDRAWGRAERSLSASADRDAPDLMARLLLAWTAAGRGDGSRARALLTPAKGEPHAIFLAYHRAGLEQFLRDPAAADAAFAAAQAATGGRNLGLALGEASHFAETGRVGEARGVLQRFLAANPGHTTGEMALAQLDAGRLTSRAIDSAPRGAALALAGIASALDEGDTSDAALVYLRLARHLAPGEDTVLSMLGGVLAGTGRAREAAEAFASIPEGSPFHVPALIAAAETLADNGLPEEAARLLENEADRGVPKVLIALGDLYRGREDWAGALALYSRAIERIPAPREGDWAAFYARGVSLERLGRYSEAEADFRMALKLRPEQPLVLNYLAYTWIEQGRNLNEALAMLERAADARPESGAIIDSLGWAHYRLGNYRKALGYLERAVDLAPYDSVINEHLGDVYWKLGRQREARFQWTHALSLDVEEDRVPFLREKLARGLDAGEALERQQGRHAQPRAN